MTEYADFRGFLDFLEKKDKLLRVQKEVDTRFEIAAGIRKVSDTDGPALLFENIKNHPGWRVAAGVFATRKLLALALEVPEEQGRTIGIGHLADTGGEVWKRFWTEEPRGEQEVLQA